MKGIIIGLSFFEKLDKKIINMTSQKIDKQIKMKERSLEQNDTSVLMYLVGFFKLA